MSDASSCTTQQPLIPGLPEDVALLCLLNAPIDKLEVCRRVSSRWRRIFGSRESFFTLRKELGMKSPWLFIQACYLLGPNYNLSKFKALDLTRLTWFDVPNIPEPYRRQHTESASVSIPHQGVMIFFSATCDLMYDVCTNRWTELKESRRRIASRRLFVSAAINGMVYVAGGIDTERRHELCSAEVFDPETRTWRPISDMGAHVAGRRDALVLDGKLLAMRSAEQGQTYDPKADRWDDMPRGLRRFRLDNGAVEIFERLFTIREAKVRVYDAGRDSWDDAEGDFPGGEMRGPYSVSSWGDDRIVVVGQCLCVCVGRIWRRRDDGVDCLGRPYSRFYVRWKKVKEPHRSKPISQDFPVLGARKAHVLSA